LEELHANGSIATLAIEQSLFVLRRYTCEFANLTIAAAPGRDRNRIHTFDGSAGTEAVEGLAAVYTEHHDIVGSTRAANEAAVEPGRRQGLVSSHAYHGSRNAGFNIGGWHEGEDLNYIHVTCK